ncbi:MAG: Ig-like domain-containing protein [Methanolobus sp.]
MEYFKKFICISSILILLSMSAMAVDIESLNSDFENSAGTPANISVLVTYTGNTTPISNALVNFTTDFGVLNSSSALTGSSGIAFVFLNSTVPGTAHLNVSTGNESVLTNGTFYPAEIASYSVVSNHSTNIAGNVNNISFFPLDAYGNVNTSGVISVNVKIDDMFGNPLHDIDIPLTVGDRALLQTNKTTYETVYNGTGPANGASLFINSTVAGNIFINSTAGLANNSTRLRIYPASPGLMRIMYDADYTVNTSSNLNVIVYDSYSNPIGNATVLFNVISPENTPFNSPRTYNSASISSGTGLTDIYGQLNNVFTTDKKAGSNIVNISVANSSLQHNVTIRGLADNIEQLYLLTSPASAIANNIDYYTLSARPVDQFLNPIIPLSSSISEQVKFTTSSRSVLIPLNSLGRANIDLGPTPYVNSVPVTATYRNSSRILQVLPIPLSPANFSDLMILIQLRSMLFECGS